MGLRHDPPLSDRGGGILHWRLGVARAPPRRLHGVTLSRMAEPVISRLPLSQLPPPFAAAKRLRDLSATEVRELLRAGPVRFLVAAVLAPFRVVPERDCYDFWKSEAQPHLVTDPTEGAALEDFPGGYCYFASEWTDGGSPIVLLSAAH